MRAATRLAIAATPLMMALSACGDPYTGDDGGEGGIVVGSADFPESTLPAQIYAQALEAEGVEATTQLDIGSREVYYDQIAEGNLSVFPEYNGAMLYYLDPEAVSGGTEETNEALREILPEGLEILDSAEAQNKDSVTVTKETADKEDLTTIGDLQDVAEDMVLGAPAEFETRPQGVPGLEETYGVTFKEFTALEGNLLVEGR